MVGSSCDIPRGSHVMYSSTIVSPMTQTLRFLIWSRISNRSLLLKPWRTGKSFGFFMVEKFRSFHSRLIISIDENVMSPDPKISFPPVFETASASELIFSSCSLPFTTKAGFSSSMKVSGVSCRINP